MRGNELLDKMELIDGTYVEEAEAYTDKMPSGKKKVNGLVRWAAVAACLTLVIVAGATLLGRRGGGTTTIIGGVERNYKHAQLAGAEMAIEWSWEYRTAAERYTQLFFDGKEFRSAGYSVSTEYLGGELGNAEALGYDMYEEKEHRLTTEVREIAEISADRMVAVKLEEDYYLFKNSEYDPPATFGELMQLYRLDQHLPFERFSVCEGHKEKGYYALADDQYIWDILSSCGEAPFSDADMWRAGEQNYLSFTATSDILGVYKRVFYVSEDGYIRTNVFDWAYLYDIGVEAARKIISYATEHGEEAEWEPYTYSVAGTLTAIEEGYLLIDDSVLCKNPKDGMVFKVSTDDLRIRRCVEFGGISVGDIVVVDFKGEIKVDAGNLVEGAYSLSEGYLHDGFVAVPE